MSGITRSQLGDSEIGYLVIAGYRQPAPKRKICKGASTTQAPHSQSVSRTVKALRLRQLRSGRFIHRGFVITVFLHYGEVYL